MIVIDANKLAKEIDNKISEQKEVILENITKHTKEGEKDYYIAKGKSDAYLDVISILIKLNHYHINIKDP